MSLFHLELLGISYLRILAAVVSLMALILIVSYRISQPKDNHVAVS
jgi:ABC-type transport system involved in cytochrome c biogenesis permease subunit